MARDNEPHDVKWIRNPRQLIKLAVLAGLLFGAYGFLGDLELGDTLHPKRIVEYLDAWGPLGPLVFIVMMATAVVVSPIPSLPLDLAAGATFGPWLGTTYAVVGAEVGAVLSFLIARILGKDIVSRLLRMNVKFCQQCSDRHLAGLVFFSRLFPVFSFDLVSYGAGLTNMSLKAFALTTLLGMIPPTFALTYFGSTVFTVEWPLILSGIGLVMIFLFLPAWIMKNRSTWWVRLIQGERPRAQPDRRPSSSPGLQPCSWCGAEIQDE